ncbi:MAG TPA: phage holin family protein [Caulobacteraceae bacterium]|nr:phage holin family protein [Caulobacteraceae bacterium]
MTSFLIRAVVSALALWLAAVLVPGIGFSGIGSLILAAVLLGVVNALVKPVLVILTLPLTILTLGLFLLVVNAAMLGLVGALVPGFEVDGFWAALLGALVVSLVSWVAGQVERRRD